MTEIELLIKAAAKLCRSLEVAAANEKKYTDDICLELERMSYDVNKIKNNLQEIKEYLQ